MTGTTAWTLGAGVLGLLELAELVVRLTLDPQVHGAALQSSTRPGVSIPFLLVLSVLGLSATLPLALPRAVDAAVTITIASIFSLTVLHVLTVAGVAAQLAVAYRLGTANARGLVVVLGLPFLLLVLAGPANDDVRVLAILLAALVPTAAAAGLAQRAGNETQQSAAAQQLMAGRLREHTARGERARIARELHDIVAHHISMIAVQAETARLTVPGMPTAGARQLVSIGDTARAGLTEMRRLLGVLRDDTDTEAVDDRRPQPGLTHLNELLDQARGSADTDIRLILSGSPRPLDPGVELAVYRIVQESLTNARRHAPGAAVDVELHYAREALHVRIRDNGPGPSGEAPPGHGLLGIRERAGAVGGQAWTGAAPGGGFVVEVSLPSSSPIPAVQN